MNQNFSILAIKHVCLNLPRLFHSTSKNFGNHYETLKLQKNCTSQQIRDSFIKLSKKHHPDLNKGPNAHKDFLQVQAAYNVLSKPHLRASYDLGLSQPGFRYESPSQGRYGPNRTVYRDPWDDPFFYRNRDKSQDGPFHESRPYDGMNIKRQRSGVVVLFVMAVLAVIFTVELVIIRYTLLKQQRLAELRSIETQRVLNEVEERARKNGIQGQLEIHRKQFEEMERLRPAAK